MPAFVERLPFREYDAWTKALEKCSSAIAKVMSGTSLSYLTTNIGRKRPFGPVAFDPYVRPGEAPRFHGEEKSGILENRYPKRRSP